MKKKGFWLLSSVLVFYKSNTFKFSLSLCLSQEMTSYRWKVRLFLFNVSCCLAAAYFFRRHNKYCEAGGEYQSIAV